MSRVSNLTAIDPRTDWKKISRRQYWRGLKALNISYPAGATQPQMIDICQAAGITPDQVTKFIPVRVETADGSGKVVMLPEDNERKYDEQKEHRRAAEMERRIAAGIENEEKRLSADKLKMETEKNVEIQGLKTELEDLKAMMQKLLEQNTESRSKPLTAETELGPALPRPQDNPLKMHWKSFQKLAKQSGIDWSTKDPREPVIEKMNENAA